jgi:NAD(P)-dependent dehydrogenase (short-subunit alcohol dehydrogenase family)
MPLCLPCGCCAFRCRLACEPCLCCCNSAGKKDVLAARTESQQRPVVIVTGGTAGVGLSTACLLASSLRKSGSVIVLAGRDSSQERGSRAANAVAQVRRAASVLCGSARGCDCVFVNLDLASLDNVRGFPARLRAALSSDEGDPADPSSSSSSAASEHSDQATRPLVSLLVNNAGIMACPYAESIDGVESQFATNHLGHFLLTVLLVPFMHPGSVVVNVASNAHYMGSLNTERVRTNYTSGAHYDPWGAYSASKVANVVFTYELQKRFHLSRCGIRAVAVHPGVLRSNLWQHGENSLVKTFCICRLASDGALPVVHAALSGRAGAGARAAPVGLQMTPDDDGTDDASDSSQERRSEEDHDAEVLPGHLPSGDAVMYGRWCCCTTGFGTLPETYQGSLQKDLWELSMELAKLENDDLPKALRRSDAADRTAASLVRQLLGGPTMAPCFWPCC